MKTLLEAMSAVEGFYQKIGPPNRPQRNHNPGDLEYGKFARDHGATGSDGRFAIFPDDATGFAAMKALLLTHYKGMTLEAALNEYAPPVENATNQYLALVCKMTGASPDTIIDTLLEAV